MGKSSSSSCLKIIVCGNDSAQNDDIHSSPEAKPSNDKRGWSFRKRSGKNRVLGNNVSSETSTFANKEAPQGGNIEFQPPIKSVIVDEKPQLPKPVQEISKPIVLTEDYSEPKPSMEVVTPEKDATYTESKVSQDEVALENISNETSAENKMVDIAVGPENDGNETSDELSLENESFVLKDESVKSAEPNIAEPEMPSENGHDAGVSIEEPVAIIVQTAVRGFLAQKEFMRLKSVVKLQAVLRGHLVRRNAVATLHCIRAIVKVQALVRARSSKSLKKKSDDVQFSTVKLLQNSFSRQLLESTSKPKSLNIKCDPMTPDSAWSWLERWMSVLTSEGSEKLEPSVPEIAIEDEVQKIMKQADTKLSSVALPESIALSETTDSKFSEIGEKSLENDENHFIDDISIYESSTVDHFSTEVINEQCHPQKQEIDDKNVTFSTIFTKDIDISNAQAEPTSLEDETDIPATGEIQQPKSVLPASEPIEIEKPKLSAKRSATSELNGEGKKLICGSRKASNPAFIAAHSKFEELTSAGNLDRATSSPSLEESVKKTNELGDVENSGTSNLQIHVDESECGTELSISSTLDSPDRSEIENAEACLEVQFVETSSQHDVVKHDCETNGLSNSSANEIASVTFKEGEVDETKNVTVDPIASEVITQVEEKLETKPSNVEIDLVPESSVNDMDSSQVSMDQKHQENGHKSSPEASPISHSKVSESQGTPSSQASVKGKRNKIDNHRSHKKCSSPSVEKRSASNPNIESSARSSTEHLPKDHKSGKRRNSFGSTKSDNADQEPRDSSSNNILPSYMQATESARAKVNSPRSSPDVHGKEVYSKKRHSLPGATGKQSSNAHLSTTQASPGAKANGSHPSNERKWLR